MFWFHFYTLLLSMQKMHWKNKLCFLKISTIISSLRNQVSKKGRRWPELSRVTLHIYPRYAEWFIKQCFLKNFHPFLIQEWDFHNFENHPIIGLFKNNCPFQKLVEFWRPKCWRLSEMSHFETQFHNYCGLKLKIGNHRQKMQNKNNCLKCKTRHRRIF